MMKFLGKILKETLALVLSAILALVLLAAIALIVARALEEKNAVRTPREAVLVFDLSCEIPDAPVDAGLLGPFLTKGEMGSRIPLSSVTTALARAAEDSRIKALLILGAGPDLPEAGLSTVAELRAALTDFKKSGKPVYAFLEDAGMRDYALASAADHVWMQPLSTLGLEGFSIERLYFGEAFGEYGVGVQTASAGKYKSAPDSFALDHMRPEDREQMSAFLADAWNAWAAMVSQSRPVEEEKLKALSQNEGALTAVEAQEAQLVDRIAYRDELVEEMTTIAGKNADGSSFSQTDLRDYAQEELPHLQNRIGGENNVVAVEYVEGDIVSGEGDWFEAGADRIVRDLEDLAADDSVKAVVLRVNSPGGDALAAERIRRAVELLGKKKAVVVSMGRLAASGGYWVSAPARRIVAEESTLTGSIGVFSLFVDVEKLSGKIGVHADGVATGPYAGMYSLFRHKDEKQMALARRTVDGVYERFLAIVAEGRSLEAAAVADLAQGRIWSGHAAVANRLADEIGSLDDAIGIAADFAGISDYRVEDVPISLSFADEIHVLLHARADASGVTALPRKIRSVAEELGKTNLFARLPFFTEGQW